MNIRFAGGVIAVALIAGGYFLKDYFNPLVVPPSVPLPPAMSPEAVDIQLQAEPVEAFKIVKSSFPEEYTALTTELSVALKAGAGQIELAGISQRAITALRQAHADEILSAPDDRLREIVTMSRDLHGAVLANEGRAVCNRFAIGGPASLDGNTLGKFVEVLDAQGSAVLKAIVEGQTDARPPSERASAADWDAARAEAVTQGISQAQLDALSTLDQADGDLCGGLIGLMGAFLAMDTPQGLRLRANYVRDLARN